MGRRSYNVKLELYGSSTSGLCAPVHDIDYNIEPYKEDLLNELRNWKDIVAELMFSSQNLFIRMTKMECVLLLLPD